MPEVKIWVEDGEVLCCSSMCEGCNDAYKCKPVPESIAKLLLALDDKSWMGVAK